LILLLAVAVKKIKKTMSYQTLSICDCCLTVIQRIT
jgi:hypothetical protein